VYFCSKRERWNDLCAARPASLVRWSLSQTAERADNLPASGDASAPRSHLGGCQESAVEQVADAGKMSKLLA